MRRVLCNIFKVLKEKKRERERECQARILTQHGFHLEFKKRLSFLYKQELKDIITPIQPCCLKDLPKEKI